MSFPQTVYRRSSMSAPDSCKLCGLASSHGNEIKLPGKRPLLVNTSIFTRVVPEVSDPTKRIRKKIWGNISLFLNHFSSLETENNPRGLNLANGVREEAIRTLIR